MNQGASGDDHATVSMQGEASDAAAFGDNHHDSLFGPPVHTARRGVAEIKSFAVAAQSLRQLNARDQLAHRDDSLGWLRLPS